MRRVASSGLDEQPGLVGQPKQFGQMQRRARALLPADHGEMVLMAVEPGHEHDAGLVEPRRRLEDVARQRHRRPQHVVEAGLVAGRKPRQRVGRGRRDGVEDAEQRVRKALVVAGDQFGIVEIVAGIHLARSCRAAGACRSRAALSSSETLTPSTLAALALMMATAVSIALSRSARAPVAGQRRIEHVAEPVDDHGLADLAEHAVVDLGVIVGAAAELRQRARGHQDDAAAGLLDRRDLLLIGADHVVDRLRVFHREMVGAGAGEHQRIAACLGGLRPSAGSVPARSASPAPCRAARCPSLRRRRGRESQTCSRNAMVRSQSIAACQPRIVVGERIGHHMRGREGDAVERAFELRRKRPRRRQAIGLDRAIRRRQLQRTAMTSAGRACSWLGLLTP